MGGETGMDANAGAERTDVTTVGVRVDARTAWELLVVLGFQVAFVGLYYLFLHPSYQYYGFTLAHDPLNVLEALVLTALAYGVVPQNESKIEALSLRVLYALLLLPLLALYAVTDGPRPYVYVVVAGFAVTCLVARRPVPGVLRSVRERVDEARPDVTGLFFSGLVVVSLVTYGLIVAFNGLPSVRALNFANVYEVRGEFVYGTPILQYLFTWQSKVFNMFLVGLGWARRRASLVVLGFALQLVVYLYTGHKLLLFAPAFVLFALYTMRTDSFLTGFLRAFLAVSVVLYGVFVVTGIQLPAYVFIGRTYFLTADTQLHYFEYFSTHDFVYLTDSKVGFFLEDRYTRPIPLIIGETYYSTGTYANTGYTGDAFSHFGYLGLLAFSAVLGGIFVGLKWTTEFVENPVAVATLLIPIYSLTQTGLTTVLLTHGLVPAVGLLLAYSFTATDEREATTAE